jgi:hypothetical protein
MMAQYSNPTRFRILEELAEHTLADSNLGDKTPIPVDALAEALHLRVNNCNLFRFGRLQGAAWFQHGTILTNSQHLLFKRRFTVAHEIGHHVLLAHAHGVREAILYGSTRRGTGASRRQLTETLANKIASSILMPQHLLQSEARIHAKLDAACLRQMAARFLVSPMAMLIRIEDLSRHNIVLGLPIDWDSIQELRVHLLKVSSHMTQQAAELNKLRPDLGILKQVPAGTPHEDVRSLGVIGIVLLKLANLGIELPDTAQTREWIVAPTVVSPLQALGRPVVIELAGMPNTGKDSLIVHTSDYLKKILGLKVKVFADEYVACPSHIQSPLLRFHWSLGSLMRNLAEIASGVGDSDVVLMNKGLFDALAFIQFQHVSGNVGREYANHLSKALLASPFRRLEDLVLWLDIPPHVSIAREENERRKAVRFLAKQLDSLNSIEDYPDNIETQERLEQLRGCYESVHVKFSHLLPQIEKIPAEASIEEVAGQLASRARRSFSPQRPLEVAVRADAESVIQMPLPGMHDKSNLE